MKAYPKSRPEVLSPHLSVYRLPLTALLSISHRGSGVILILAFVGGNLLLGMAAAAPIWFDSLIRGLPATLILLLRFGLSLALAVHITHGVRHLLWDLGLGFQRTRLTQWALVELLFIAALTLAILLLGPAGDSTR